MANLPVLVSEFGCCRKKAVLEPERSSPGPESPTVMNAVPIFCVEPVLHRPSIIVPCIWEAVSSVLYYVASHRR
jgi:hypothetical protein